LKEMGREVSEDATQEIAEAASFHPQLIRFAASELSEPESKATHVVERLRNLAGEDLQDRVESMIGEMYAELGRRKPRVLALLDILTVFSGGATVEALRALWAVERRKSDIEKFTELISARRKDLVPLMPPIEEAIRAARRASLVEYDGNRYELH